MFTPVFVTFYSLILANAQPEVAISEAQQKKAIIADIEDEAEDDLDLSADPDEQAEDDDDVMERDTDEENLTDDASNEADLEPYSD